MWTVIYIAPNEVIAGKYKQSLSEEGILVQLKPMGGSQSGENRGSMVEILVPKSEAEDAHEILTNLLNRT